MKEVSAHAQSLYLVSLRNHLSLNPMPADKNYLLSKFFLIILFLSIYTNSFSQINFNDSLNYFQHLKIDSSFGNNIKGKTLESFVLKDKKGNSFTNDSLRSKITFINFWFEGCHPCLAEFEALEKFYINNKSKKDFQFISISFDPDSVIERVRKEHGLTYPIYHLPHDSCMKLEFGKGYPTSLIVNKKREIVYSSSGGPIDPGIADKFLNYFVQAELDKQLK